MKNLLVTIVMLTLALVISFTVAAPAFAQGPGKIQDSGPSLSGIMHGLYNAVRHFCCHPWQGNGPMNAKEVFNVSKGVIWRY